VVAALHRWLDTWAALGLITAGMARPGFDLQLTRYAEAGWRATFYVSGMEHSPTRATGTAWERSPFLAVQRAAWEALRRSDDNSRVSGDQPGPPESCTRNQPGRHDGLPLALDADLIAGAAGGQKEICRPGSRSSARS
jgi:hypothetical protein